MQLDSDRKAAALVKNPSTPFRMKLIPFIVREVEPRQALLKNFTLDSNWKIGELVEKKQAKEKTGMEKWAFGSPP